MSCRTRHQFAGNLRIRRGMALNAVDSMETLFAPAGGLWMPGTPPQREGQESRHCRRQPDPNEFILQNRKAAGREKPRHTYRRDQDRTPWQKITRRIERREERNPESAVGQGVEQTVTCRGEEKIETQPSSVT